MIYLIGGSSHVGKTLLAQNLLEQLHYPYLSLDHLKMGLIRTKMTSLTVEDDDEMRDFLWPIAAEMVKTAIENRQNLIVEGCYIPADWRSAFSEDYLRSIRSVFLVMNEDYLRTHFDEVRGYADVIEQRLCDDPDLERLIRCSGWFREECLRCGTPVLEISGEYDADAITERAKKLLKIF